MRQLRLSTSSTSIRLGQFALCGGILLSVFLLAAALAVLRNPTPQTIDTTDSGATIHFAVDRTYFIFPGDCSTGQWQVDGIREVYFYTEGVVGSGEITACNGDAPYLRVVLQDGSSRTYLVDRDVLMMNPMMSVVGVSALVLLGLAGYWLGVGRLLKSQRGEYALVTFLAVGMVLLLRLYTRASYIVVGVSLDAGRTLEIAVHGWIGNPNIWAPWAYRPLTSLTARFIADLLAQRVEIGFLIFTLTGMIALLVLVYRMARHFGADFRAGFVAMLVVWMSYFIVRLSVGDIYRPDQWAYPFIIIALLLLFNRRWGWCLLVCAIGILIREFMVIPAALLALTVFWDAVRHRSLRSFLWLMVIGVTIGAVVILPRRLIPVAGSEQIFAPENSGLTYSIMQPLSNTPRNAEFLMGFLVFMLPALLLMTPSRVKYAWRALAGYRWMLGIYILLVFGLTMYGGSGVQRYMTYLLVPLIILLALWVKDAGNIEILLMLAAVALCNRLFWMVRLDPFTQPVTFAEFHQVAPYLPRFYELALYFGTALILRLARYYWPSRRQIHAAVHAQ